MQDTVEDEWEILPTHSSPARAASKDFRFTEMFDTPIQYPDLDLSICFSVSSFDILSTYHNVTTEAQPLSPAEFYSLKTEEN